MVSSHSTYSATVSSSITLATSVIAATIDCEIRLNEPPPDQELVNVLFDGAPVPFDEEDGWRWVDESTLELVGAQCDLLEGGQVSLVDIVAGCPVVLR